MHGASCVLVFELKTKSHAGADTAHGPKQPPASPNVVVYACVTNPRLATRAARIIAAILAWLVPAAVLTHRGLYCARRQSPCAVHLSPLAFFLLPNTAPLATASARLLGGFKLAGSRLHSQSGLLHPRQQVVGRTRMRIRPRGRSSLWRRCRNSLWRRGRSSLRRRDRNSQGRTRPRLRIRARWHRRRRPALGILAGVNASLHVLVHEKALQ